jgi:general secretion pathway protein M
MNTPLTWRQALAPLQQAWKQRSPREQRLLGGCAVLVLLASVWSLALAPALRTWQEAPERQARLDAQSQSMRQLQAQAIDLQKPRAVPRNEAALWLEKNLAELGPNAKISLQGERATLSLEAAPADALARWLSQARESAQALPLQAQLQQNTASAPQGANGSAKNRTTPGPTAASVAPPATAGETVLWRGSLVLRLP